GHPILDFYAQPDEREIYLAQLQKQGRVKNYPVSLIKKNGEDFNVSMSSTIVFNQHKEPQYIEGVFLDITQEVQIAKEREGVLHHLQSLSAIEGALAAPSFEQSIKQAMQALLPIYDADRVFLLPVSCADTEESSVECHDMVFLTQKQGFEDFCAVGFVKDEGVRAGLALRDTDTDTDTDTEFCPVVIDKSSVFSFQVIEKYDIKSHMMIVVSTAAGDDWLLVVQRCRDAKAWTKQQKRLLTDISHRLRAAIGQLILQKDLQVSVERAEVASKAKGEFLATMSHELRTPLHGVIGLLGLLEIEASRLSDEQKNNLALAQSTAHILGSLIDDVLDLSKIESGKLEVQHQPFAVEQVLRSALIPFVMKAREKGLLLSLEMKDVAQTMSGDVLYLRQVLLNLVGNALKFTDAGFVRVTVWQTDEIWQISIEDSGIGIALDQQLTVFTPFVQVHDNHVLGENLQDKGTGLGTTIAKRFVEIMGGEISLRSALGVGTTFDVKLPLAAVGSERISLTLELADLALQQQARLDEVVVNRENNQVWSVLLAEDDPIGRKIAIKQLERTGFTVEAVADGEKALAKVQKKQYDLLLTDVRMPIMDGMMLTKKIREYEAESKIKPMFIVGLSAHALEEVKHEALAHGMDEFVSKPVDMQALMAKLESHCVVEGS
ncbi:MAG: response regulator, partial [Mariprofundaceae bacterium]|nr:response regulator [Mariprofundaceae bacterium]